MNATEPTIKNFKHHVRVAELKRHDTGTMASCYLTVSYTDGRLSITGVEGPKDNGDCYGSCGQCQDMNGWIALPGMDLEKIKEIWKTWHLNDMQAGTPKQTECLKKFFAEDLGYPNNDYDHQCEYLANHDLLFDNGYKYGSAWLKVEVPTEVLEYLRSLPQSETIPNRWK